VSRLSVITLSQAFQGFWNDLALDLDTAIDLVGPADAVTSSPETVAVIVAAGGAERDATQWLETHRVRPGLPALVVGTDPGRRTAMQLVARGASDYFALPDDLEIFRNAVAAAVRGGGARGAAAPAGRENAFAAIVGESETLTTVLARAARLLPHRNASVLIVGEQELGRSCSRARCTLADRAATPRSSPSTARPSRSTSSSRSCSVTSAGHSRTRMRRSPGCSRWRTPARCSSTRSATSRSACRPSCCARWRTRRSGASGARNRARWTSALWRRPTTGCRTASRKAGSGKISSSAGAAHAARERARSRGAGPHGRPARPPARPPLARERPRAQERARAGAAPVPRGRAPGRRAAAPRGDSGATRRTDTVPRAAAHDHDRRRAGDGAAVRRQSQRVGSAARHLSPAPAPPAERRRGPGPRSRRRRSGGAAPPHGTGQCQMGRAFRPARDARPRAPGVSGAVPRAVSTHS